MQGNRWDKFDEYSDRAFMEMISENPRLEPWLEAFEVFQETVDDVRREEEEKNRFLKNSGAAGRGEKLSFDEFDNDTGWGHDVSGWLYDFLDELDMHEDHRHILEAVDYLEDRFDFEDDDVLDLKSRKCIALMDLGEMDKAYRACREWLNEVENTEDGYEAAADMIQICTKRKQFDEAAELIRKWIGDAKECGEDDYAVFAAAKGYYRAIGDSRNALKMQTLMDESDERDEQDLMKEFGYDPDDSDGDDFDDGFDDDELPFS